MVDARDLLAIIHRQPHDDAPRHVYADWLNERGDPRGELIALQLAPNRTPSMQRRERVLLGKYGKAWLGGLADVITRDYEFRRGFLARVTARFRNAEQLAEYARYETWATIEELAFSTPPMFPVEESAWRYGMLAAMVGLRFVDGHAKALLASGATFPVERATLRFDDLHVFRELARSMCTPKLRVLAVDDVYATPEWLEGVASVPWTKLQVRSDERTDEWFAHASRVGISTMVFGGREVKVKARVAPQSVAPKSAVETIRAAEAAMVCAEGVWVAESSRLVLVDAASGRRIRQIETNSSAARAFGGDRAVLVTEAWSECVALADGKTTRFPMRINARCVSVSADGAMAIAGNGTFCEAWDLRKQTRLLYKNAIGHPCAVSRDGTFVAFGANPAPGVGVCSIAPRGGITRRSVVRLGSSTRLTGMCFLADGTLVSAHGPTGLRRWNPVTGDPLAIPKHTAGGPPSELVASPIGSRVAFRSGEGGPVRLLDVDTGQARNVGSARVWCFTQDGRALVLVDETVRVAL